MRVYEGFPTASRYYPAAGGLPLLVQEGVTDADGLLTIDGPPGLALYGFEIAADGYVPYFDEAEWPADLIWKVALRRGEERPIYVLEADGTPIADAKVLQGNPPFRRLRTDADGRIVGPVGLDMMDRDDGYVKFPLAVELPGGGVFIFQRQATKTGELVVTEERIEARVSLEPVTVRLEGEVPEDSRVEGRAHRFPLRRPPLRPGP